MQIMEKILQSKDKILVYPVLISIIVVIVGVVMFPHLFYDQWIWKYYWGPVVADSMGGVASHNGVLAQEGYTIVSEITYGILVILALYGIYRLLKRLKIQVNWRFAIALMPYILLRKITYWWCCNL